MNSKELIPPGYAYSNKYKRKVNKNDIPVCSILGVDIAAVNMEWILEYLKANINASCGNMLNGDYMCVSNVHTTVTAHNDPEYRKVQNGGLMAIPDGGPLSTVGRKRGYQDMRRTTGPGLMHEVFKISVENGYKHYFYGNTQETLDRLKEELIKKYPGLHISGMCSPPFRALSVEEDKEIIRMINQTEPDFVWVGLGAPKQEKWMAEHQGTVDGFMIGVGAGFDYFAGNIKRAPEWMQKCNMEWFCRLIQDPKRLFKRYMSTNFKFIWLAMMRGK